MTRAALLAALIGAATLIALLLGEGAYSAVCGESLLRRAMGAGAARRAVMRDAERVAAAGLTVGPFALAHSPHVGITLKPGHTGAFVGAAWHTDGHGQRVRPGPPPQSDAPRIVVLGDSVAFGFGVADNETYAAVLEEVLTAAQPEGVSPPAAWTVACPGWNTTNAARYLRAHLDRLRPDVVLCIPVRNDLDDSFLVDEVGQQASRVDPIAGAALPHVNYADYLDLYIGVAQRTPLDRIARAARIGRRAAFDHVLRTGVTPESQRRWSAFGAEIAMLAADLKARGARMAVVTSWAEDFQLLAQIALARACPEVPIVPLFADRTPADGLPDDPHPNARCVRAGALRIADWLIDQGWIDGDAGSVPTQLAEYAGREATLLDPDALDSWHAEHLAAVWAFLGGNIDLRDATGFHQVYGGLHADGTVGRCLFAALADRDARHLVIEGDPVAALAGTPVPLDLALRAGPDEGWIRVPASLPPGTDSDGGKAVIGLPEAVRGAACIDVAVRPSRLVAETEDGVRRWAAFRLRRLSLR